MNTLAWYEARITDPADVDGAFAFCQRLAESHYENFPVASLLIPKALRRHVAALYAFARIADDFSDEREYEGVRIQRLEDWRRQLWAVGAEAPQHPVFLALEKTFQELSLPKEPFDDLLSAFLQDCTKRRYATFAQVLDYCRRSANPVGRIVLMIHGYREQGLFVLSDSICTALQIANFLQDVGVDLKKDRIYLPQEDFERFGYTEDELLKGIVDERFRRLMDRQWERTQDLFERGRALPSKLRWPLSWEIRLTWLGGMAVLDKVRELGFDTLSHRPALRRWDWLRLSLGLFTALAC